jgi:hypothetical protein
MTLTLTANQPVQLTEQRPPLDTDSLEKYKREAQRKIAELRKITPTFDTAYDHATTQVNPFFKLLDPDQWEARIITNQASKEAEDVWEDIREMCWEISALLRQPDLTEVAGKLSEKIISDVQELISGLDFSQTSAIVDVLYPSLLALKHAGVIKRE